MVSGLDVSAQSLIVVECEATLVMELAEVLLLLRILLNMPVVMSWCRIPQVDF
jgi:hypothetical protein